MEPIEGIDLASLTEEAKLERIAELARAARLKIQHIIGRNVEAQGSIRSLEKQLVKAKERLVKEQARLAKLESGDWSVLQDEQQPQGDKTQPALEDK